MCKQIWTWLKNHAYPPGPKPWEKPFPEPPTTLENDDGDSSTDEGAK